VWLPTNKFGEVLIASRRSFDTARDARRLRGCEEIDSGRAIGQLRHELSAVQMDGELTHTAGRLELSFFFTGLITSPS